MKRARNQLVLENKLYLIIKFISNQFNFLYHQKYLEQLMTCFVRIKYGIFEEFSQIFEQIFTNYDNSL